MTSHELARKLLKQPNVPIRAMDPNWEDWSEISGIKYDEEYEVINVCINGDTGDE